MHSYYSDFPSSIAWLRAWQDQVHALVAAQLADK